MKIISEQIAVTTDRTEGRPASVEWRGERYSVRRVQEEWCVATRWWEREVRRRYLVLATDLHTMEVYSQEGTWILYRIYGA